MELKKVEVSLVKVSGTNPRPEGDYKSASFKELVSSIREKGILAPILVRAVVGGYEVIAGERRYRAAKEIGMEMIPAHVVTMNDAEAREAQIVENMQRADIHPMDEGEAFRYLVEELNHDAEGVAKRVGKSITYVRQRLGFTNLIAKVQVAFRKGDISIGHAELIAKLEEKQQKDALKEVMEYGMDVSRLRTWIRERVYTDLSNRPWAKDAKLAEMVGDVGAKGESLFGEADEQDPVTYATRMAAYIEMMIRKASENGEMMYRISTAWGTPTEKVAIGRDQYKVLNSKEDKKKASEVVKGIVVEGRDLGQIYAITTVAKDLKEERNYQSSPEEKAKRKAEREKEAKKREKDHEDTKAAVARMKWPMTEKQLGVIVDIALEQASHDVVQSICKRREYEAEKQEGWNGRDYAGAVAKAIKTMSAKEKVGLLLELIMPGYSQYSDGRKKWIAKI